jgi:hypothetical protein
MDRKATPDGDKRMLIVGPGGLTFDRSELEELMRTRAEDLVRDVAIEVWRMRRRFDRLSLEAKGVAGTMDDSLTQVEDVLMQHDVRYTVHDGEVYDAGLAVEVLEAQGDRDQPQIVKETVRPGVTWQGRALCRAQVIVLGGDPSV